jgi:hypothetical protein
MNKLIKTITIVWLGMSAIFVWLGCALLGFMSTFIGNMSLMFNVTPFIGLACVICIINCMMRVYKSNPLAYFEHLLNRVKRLI